MMGRYRRTVSFPNAPAAPGNSRPAKSSYHVRSASLPCNRTHPLIPHLRDEVNELQSWFTTTGSDPARVCQGLTRLKTVLDSLDDVLQLPQTQDSLSSKTHLVENLLEHFLRFVDSYGIFRAAVLGLKEELSGAQVAIRRKDTHKLRLHVKAQKKIANKIGKLITDPPCSLPTHDHNDTDDLHVLIGDVHRVTWCVSGGVFGAVWRSLGSSRRGTWGDIGNLWKKKEGVEVELEGLKKMEEREEWVGEMERESERVFRSLISMRVSLLNILTHA